jgi:aerobic-type carbon monoxide dehydrogenase small subunit (CoxS/CutS family)
MLAVQADGAEVITVEGLTGVDGSLHPIQEAFAEEHGLQCGFCTPGVLMAVHALLAENPDAGEDEIREVLGGQLCRCTGYHSILRSALRAAADLRAAATKGTT